MAQENWNGDKKFGKPLLHDFEQGFIKRYVGSIPAGIETYHLTLLTIVWCAGILFFSYLAKYNLHWLWPVSLMIVLQYLTDAFDGALGRLRNTGLIRWGYYMDHFLDYIFLCSILIGYSFIVPNRFKFMLLFVLALFGGYMVNSFLVFAATNSFKIVHMGIGPTEIRIMFIVINLLLIIFGKTFISAALPYVLGISFLGLIYVVYTEQHEIWKIDMTEKDKNSRIGNK